MTPGAATDRDHRDLALEMMAADHVELEERCCVYRELLQLALAQLVELTETAQKLTRVNQQLRRCLEAQLQQRFGVDLDQVAREGLDGDRAA